MTQDPLKSQEPLRLTRLLLDEEFAALNKECSARGFYAMDPRVIEPGWAWFEPWVYDPSGVREERGLHVMIPQARRGMRGHLSQHYWRDWSERRPPIAIMGPDGNAFEPDRESSNNDGAGWRIVGDWPRITITPSIVLKGWHGWVADGVFSADCEGRGVRGTMRELGDRARPATG